MKLLTFVFLEVRVTFPPVRFPGIGLRTLNLVFSLTTQSVITLTLRLLMSYIYIYMEQLFLVFLDHPQRRSTVGRTPLDE